MLRGNGSNASYEDITRALYPSAHLSLLVQNLQVKGSEGLTSMKTKAKRDRDVTPIFRVVSRTLWTVPEKRGHGRFGKSVGSFEIARDHMPDAAVVPHCVEDCTVIMRPQAKLILKKPQHTEIIEAIGQACQMLFQ